MKNLVLSYATNINPLDFSRLVRSARAFLPVDHTDIVIFTDSTNPELLATAQELSVRLVPALSIWGQVQSSRFMRILFRALFEGLEWNARLFGTNERKQVVQDAVTAVWIHPITARHFSYLQFLAQNPHYRLVLLTDARDVVFQGDPFSSLEPGMVHVFLQDESLLYGLSNLDTNWYRGIYGAAVLDEIRNKPIASAGTVFGDVESLLHLERAMFAEIVRLKRGVVDQAVYNRLINAPGRTFAVKLHANLTSCVATFGEVPFEKYEIDSGRIRVKSHYPAVLHQYDRVTAVMDMVKRNLA